MNMSLKAILVTYCLVGIVFTVPLSEDWFGRNLQYFSKGIDAYSKSMHKNCSDARVKDIKFEVRNCDSSAIQTMFCQANRALHQVNKHMCKNVTEIQPDKLRFEDGNCTLPTDRITMKQFLPKLKDYIEKLYHKCVQRKDIA